MTTPKLAFALSLLLAAAAHAQSPGDDFFRYANDDWLKATEIPAGKGAWGARAEIAEKTRQQLSKVLADAKAAPAGSDARKLSDFHAAYLNDAAIEARGLSPLAPVMARVARIRDKASLTRYLGSELGADVDPMNVGVFNSAHVVGLAVQAGNHGEAKYVAYLLQGGLGLPDREDYFGTDARTQAARDGYMTKIRSALERLQLPAARAEGVMALETAIARSHATREASAEDHDSGAVWSLADFAREAPGMDWKAFFASAGLAKQQEFMTWQPSAMKGVAGLVTSQPLQAWTDYLRVHALLRYADVLPGHEQSSARAGRAMAATQAGMGDALGKLYAERYFPPGSKARVQGIVANVVSSFTRRVEAAAWMSPSMKSMAIAKLKNLYFGVGYPERWER
jgi:putative endopeptidase